MYMGPANGGKLMYNSNFREKTMAEKSKKYRTILHVDANCFFASCETILHPEYAKVPMAVCGSAEERHGIVLAKNDLAKRYNIKTAEPVWSAKQKCPELLIVRPTYGLYEEVSQKMNRIFYDYTDLVESFGIDESWLDVTGSLNLFGDGKTIADSIRKRVREEIGITVSVGVSFNKVFAKLGSDMQKHDATTVIPPEKFASTIWHLPVSDLLFVGPACAKKLEKVGIKTIGELAVADSGFLSNYLGKNGVMLKNFALGRDYAKVTPMGYEPQPKSVSNGMTFRANLVTKNDISFAVTYLSMSVAERLRKHNMRCNTVAVTIRSNDLSSKNRQKPLSHPTCLYSEISKNALEIIYKNHPSNEEIYSVTVHAENLVLDDQCAMQQQLFFDNWEREYQKHYALETTIDAVRKRFGKNSLNIASAINNHLIG